MNRPHRFFRLSLLASAMLLACGENDAEKANRAALVPLVHRDHSLSDEFAQWVKNNEVNGTTTYAEVFAQYDKFKAAKDSLQSDVRKVVPTPKYDCLISLLTRSIAADEAMMTAREAWVRHRLARKTASALADKYIAEARASEYGGSTYIQLAREQITETEDEDHQVEEFQRASNSNALTASAIGDSLTAAVLEFKLLPSMEPPMFPIVTDSGPDSLTRPVRPLPIPVCRTSS